MKTAEQVTVVTRAKAFTHEGTRDYRFLIDPDGTVRVWDKYAQHYTACHVLSDSEQKRIRDLASK